MTIPPHLIRDANEARRRGFPPSASYDICHGLITLAQLIEQGVPVREEFAPQEEPALLAQFLAYIQLHPMSSVPQFIDVMDLDEDARKKLSPQVSKAYHKGLVHRVWDANGGNGGSIPGVFRYSITSSGRSST